MFRKTTIAALLTLLLAGPAAADFNDGVVAHLMGQYDKAFNTMMPLAEVQNHPLAQYYLGIMYANGQGVQQNHEEAAKWFRAAAEQGVMQAQYRLAELYSSGQGVPQDYEHAYAWYSVAVSQGHGPSQAGLEGAAARLSQAELVEAQKLSVEYTEKYARPPEAEQAP